MFGTNTTTQSNDDPAMLDNVKQLANQPADQVSAPQPAQATNQPPAQNQPSPQPTTNISTPTPAPTAPAEPQNQATQQSSEPLHGFSMDAPAPQTTQTDSNAPQQTNATTDTPTEPTDSGQPQKQTATGVQLGSFSPSVATTDSAVETDTPATSTATNTSTESTTSTETSRDESQPQADPNHLAGLKQQALQHLEPLSEHLGDTPEEQFKTTMMMIQANDNHTLLEKALAAAQKIEDDKVRAQAMLDIINEINYFSQNQ